MVIHVVLGTVVGTVFDLLAPAQYTSTADMNLGVENSEANLSNTFNYLTSIMPMLVEIETSESIFAEVPRNAGINQDELCKSVSVTNKTGTTLMEIRVTSTDPERAYRIIEAELTALDLVAHDLSSSGQAGNTTAVFRVVDSPTTPFAPLNLSAMPTALIGTAIGLTVDATMAIPLYFLSQKNPQDKVEDPLFTIGRRHSQEDAWPVVTQTWSQDTPHQDLRAPSDADPESSRELETAWGQLEVMITVVLLICVGVCRELAAALSIGSCIALASVPITWTAVRKAYHFLLLFALSVLASGTVHIMSLLTESSFVVEVWVRRVTTSSLLAVPCVVAIFVWRARRLDTRRTTLAVGFDMSLDVLPLLQTSSNPWKFGIGAAVTIMVLSLVADRHRLVQIITLLVLSDVFLVSDSHSTLAFLATILGTTI